MKFYTKVIFDAMKYYFYCPYCRNEYETQRLPNGTVSNTRGGFGRPIHHYECSICGNLDAGFMRYFSDDNGYYLDSYGDKLYFRKVIALYQGIRGFSVRKS